MNEESPVRRSPDQLPFVDEHAVVIDAPPEPVVVVRRMLDAVARSARRGA